MSHDYEIHSRLDEKIYLNTLIELPSNLDRPDLLDDAAIYHEYERQVYRAIREAYAQGGDDAIRNRTQIQEALRQRGIMDDAWSNWRAPISFDIDGVMGTLRDLHRRRILFSRISEVRHAIGGLASMDDIAQHLSDCVTLCAPEEERAEVQTLYEATASAYEAARLAAERGPDASEMRSLLPTLESGYGLGELTVIAASPGVGKSAFALQEARKLAKQGHGVLYISLEMRGEELARRILSAKLRVGTARMRSGDLATHEWDAFHSGLKEVHGLPVWVNDETDVRIGQVRRWAKDLKQRRGLKLIVLDYMQLMRAPEGSESKTDAMGRIARELKILASDLDTHVIAISSLNRRAETENRAPRMSDLRQSGEIEYTANKIILLHPEEAAPEDAEDERRISAIIAKQRDGRLGTDALLFHGPTYTFTLDGRGGAAW